MTERALSVVEAGLLTTVQDLGRSGWGAAGIPSGGALDPDALRVANLLVGNPEGAAGLEITLLGPALTARGPIDLAVAGGDFGPAPGRVIGLRDGETLALRLREGGRGSARAAVAFAGGIDVPEILGSRSTCVVARFGGLHGGPLKTGDVVPLGAPCGSSLPEAAAPPLPALPEFTLRVLPGPQADFFDEGATELFFSSTYRLRPESNRMGARFAGPAVPGDPAAGGEMASEGTPLGAVQIPPDGQPIVLLNERPTTGGYPKIATVIAADLSLLVRAQPGAVARFARVSLEEARLRLSEKEERIRLWVATLRGR